MKMAPMMKLYLNKTILVSIPQLFPDKLGRALTLRGVEANGLWLHSDELAKILLPEDRQIYASAGPVVFVPFAQIAGVVILTGTPAGQTVPSAAASAPDDAKKGG